MGAIRKVRLGNEELRIFRDTDTCNSPRDWDNLGVMVCFHKRYALGDNHHDLDHKDFNSWDEIEEHLWKREKAVIVMPLYLYDHSIQRIKVGSFYGVVPYNYARFDSGQVGFIYTTSEAIRECFGMKRASRKAVKKAETILRDEVTTYDQYIMGNVFHYELVKFKKLMVWENDREIETEVEIDLGSCGGFLGDSFDDNNMLEYLDAKWKDALGSSVYE